MGTFYQPEQQTAHRIVALKVIKAGMTATRFCAALSRNPRRWPAAASRIAQIYDAGTADSGFGPHPYFAMKFIQGRPLLRYAGMESAAERPFQHARVLQFWVFSTSCSFEFAFTVCWCMSRPCWSSH